MKLPTPTLSMDEKFYFENDITVKFFRRSELKTETKADVLLWI